MVVFVAGATGVLGRPTVEALIRAGHRVRGVARSPDKAAALRRAGGEAVETSLFDEAALRRGTAGCDAVLNLATHIPAPGPWTRRRHFAENDRLRTVASRLLVGAALGADARVYVQESITFVYADHGADWIREGALLAPTAVTASALDAEREAERFHSGGGRGVSLRFGAFYASHARSTIDGVRLARLGLFPVPGSGAQYLASIHVQDAAAAVVAALDAPAGVYNVCDDEPVPVRDYVEALALAFGYPRPRRLPAWLVRTALGPTGEILLRSQRVANRRFRETTGWAPRYASVREGWRQVAREFGG